MPPLLAGRAIHFATCTPGLEPILHAEIKALKLARPERQVGGVRFEGTMRDAWRANLWLRTAIRVLRRVHRFEATSGDRLYDEVVSVPWEEVLAPSGTLLVDAQTTDSALDHSRFVEQRVKDAIVDRLRDHAGERPSVQKDAPDLRVHAHLFRDRVTISVDTSGDSLHKRGWRRSQGLAPLSETTAAGIVLASGWDRRAPLLDPFCGSGTLAIEAAWIASGRAPGSLREAFGFERWLGHDARAFAAERDAARRDVKAPRKLRILGWDADPERIREARENAAAASVDELVTFEVADARDFAPRPGWNAWIVTNPPYGTRLGNEDELVAVYRRFGDVLHRDCAGSRLALFTGNPKLRKQLGYPKAERRTIVHGGLRCELVLTEL